MLTELTDGIGVPARTAPSLEQLFAADMELHDSDPGAEGEPTESPENDSAEPSEEEGSPEEGQPESEEDGEEPEEEAAEDEEPVDADPLSQIDPDAKLFDVKVDGTEEKWSLAELKKSASREGHWTRKMQQAAEKERAAEQLAAQLESDIAEYREVLPQFRKALEELTGEPNWAELRKSLSADQYAQAVADHQVRTRNLEKVKAEEARVAADLQRRQDQEFERYAAQQRQMLLESIPSWKKPEIAQKELGEIASFARSQGWSEQELASLNDHRAIKIMRMAYLHHKAQAKAPELKKKVAAAKPAGAGTSARTVQPASPGAAAMKRLAQTGSPVDARSVFEDILARQEGAKRGRR